MNEWLEHSRYIVPLSTRKENIIEPLTVKPLINYEKNRKTINKNQTYNLVDNSSQYEWLLRSNSGEEFRAPSVIFQILPPDFSSVEYSSQVKMRFDLLCRELREKRKNMKINTLLKSFEILGKSNWHEVFI